MGLDMYFYAKRYCRIVDYDKGKQEEKIEEIKGMFEEMKGKRLPYITFEMGYLRKANAIHKWLVDNTQDGNDDCHESFVDTNKLKELKLNCMKVLDSLRNKEKVKKSIKVGFGNGKEIYDDIFIFKEKDLITAKELLPTQEGFFFGGTEYTDIYINDLEETIKIIDKCLELGEEWEIYYYASW